MTIQTDDSRTPLRRARERLNLRLEDVASAAGVSIRTVFDAERGRHAPHRSTMKAIAEALALRPQELWPETEFRLRPGMGVSVYRGDPDEAA
jgi:transcriptional regulator with XRE-family HTH domain